MGKKFSKKENKLMARLLALVLCAVLLCGIGVIPVVAYAEDEVVEQPEEIIDEVKAEAAIEETSEAPVVEDSKGPWTVKFNIGDEAKSAGVTVPAVLVNAVETAIDEYDSLKVDDGAVIVMPTLSWEGRVLIGWSSVENNIASLEGGRDYTVNKDVEFKAMWTAAAPVSASDNTSGIANAKSDSFGINLQAGSSGSNSGTFNHLEIAVKMNATFIYNGKEYKAAITVSPTQAKSYKDAGNLKLYSYTGSRDSAVDITKNYTIASGNGDSFGNTTFEFSGSFSTGTASNPVHYVATLTMDVTFTAADGSGATYTAPVTFEVDTWYWDPNNACPGCSSYSSRTGLTHRDAWNNGKFVSGSGIDVTFGAASGMQNDVGDVSITKVVEGYTFPAGTEFTFTITNKNDSNQVYTVKATLDGNGTGLAIKLGAPYGTYVISEVDAVTPDGYTLTTTYEPQEVTIDSTHKTASATVNNKYSKSETPDEGYIIVRKVFKGISKDQIPSDFKITVKNNSGGSTYELTSANKSSEVIADDSIIWTWDIRGVGVGTYTVDESGYKIEGLDVTCEGTGTDVEIKAGSFDVLTSDVIRRQDKNDFDVYVNESSNVMFASLLTTNHVVIVSEKELTASQRANVIASVSKAYPGNWSTGKNIYDFYSIERHGTAFDIAGAHLTYYSAEDRMNIQATNEWTHVAKVSYAITPASTADISVTNTYTPNVTDVTIKKVVTGNLGDVNKKFQFYVQGDENHTLPGDPAPKDNKIGFQLSNGEEYKLEGVQVGTTLTIWEEGADGYIVKYDGKVLPSGASCYSVIVEDSTAVTVTVTNIKDELPDTGISLDSLPYILILVGVGAVGVVMFLKKRRDAYDA